MCGKNSRELQCKNSIKNFSRTFLCILSKKCGGGGGGGGGGNAPLPRVPTPMVCLLLSGLLLLGNFFPLQFSPPPPPPKYGPVEVGGTELGWSQ